MSDDSKPNSQPKSTLIPTDVANVEIKTVVKHNYAEIKMHDLEVIICEHYGLDPENTEFAVIVPDYYESHPEVKVGVTWKLREGESLYEG